MFRSRGTEIRERKRDTRPQRSSKGVQFRGVYGFKRLVVLLDGDSFDPRSGRVLRPERKRGDIPDGSV